MSVTSVVTAALGVLIYAGVVWVDAATVVLAFAVAGVFLAVLAIIGWRVGAAVPDLAASLMRCWTGCVGVFMAGVAALATHAATQLTSEGLTGRGRVVAGAVLGVFLLAVEQISKVIDSHRASRFSEWAVCGRYRDLFQAMPASPGPGRAAYEQCLSCWSTFDPDDWTLRATEARLAAINSSLAAGDYFGGPNFVPAPNPPPFPST